MIFHMTSCLSMRHSHQGRDPTWLLNSGILTSSSSSKGGGNIFLVVRQRILMVRLCAAKFSNLIIFMIMTSS